MKVAQHVVTDYYEQRELVDHLERIGRRIVQRLEPRFQQSVDAGGVDAEKVANALGHVLLREGSAKALLQYNMQPDRLTAAWREAHPDRWSDFNQDERQLYEAALEDARAIPGRSGGGIARFSRSVCGASGPGTRLGRR